MSVFSSTSSMHEFVEQFAEAFLRIGICWSSCVLLDCYQGAIRETTINDDSLFFLSLFGKHLVFVL